MMRSLLKAAVIAAAVLGAPATSLASPFNGPYIGAVGSYSRTNYERVATSSALSTMASNKGDGFGIGGIVGFGYTLWFIHLGVEGEIAWESFRADVTSSGITTVLEADTTYGGSVKLGVTPLPSILIYGRLGHQWTEFEQTNRASVVTLGSAAKRADGRRYGGGIAAALGGSGAGDNLIASLEYTRTDYEIESVRVNLFTNTANIDQESLRLGFAFRF